MADSPEEAAREAMAIMQSQVGPVMDVIERGGQVYRAQMSSVIMPDGYMTERWESSVAHFKHFRQVIVW